MTLRLVLSRLVVIPVAALALVSHHTFSEDSRLDYILEVTGFGLLLVAAMGRIWCSAFISGRKNVDLVADGPYSISRNPLYFFSLLGFLGAGLAFESVTLAAALGVVFFITHWPAIRREEKKLAELFGDRFEAYRRRVPLFIPNPLLLRMPAAITISPRLFTRTMAESSLVVCIFFVAHSIEWYHNVHPQSVLLLIP